MSSHQLDLEDTFRDTKTRVTSGDTVRLCETVPTLSFPVRSGAHRVWRNASRDE